MFLNPFNIPEQIMCNYQSVLRVVEYPERKTRANLKRRTFKSNLSRCVICNVVCRIWFCGVTQFPLLCEIMRSVY